MGNCMATGRAAGVAAALAADQRGGTRDIDVQEIRCTLTGQGVDLSMAGRDQSAGNFNHVDRHFLGRK